MNLIQELKHIQEQVEVNQATSLAELLHAKVELESAISGMSKEEAKKFEEDLSNLNHLIRVRQIRDSVAVQR